MLFNKHKTAINSFAKLEKREEIPFNTKLIDYFLKYEKYKLAFSRLQICKSDNKIKCNKRNFPNNENLNFSNGIRIKEFLKFLF